MTLIVGMTTSLDGFVADRDGSNQRLYPDRAALRETPFMRAMIDQTGAVLMGKRTFEMGDPDWCAGNYEFQVPIFVVTHQPPGAGLRLLDDPGLGRLRLEKLGTEEIGPRTSLRFRILR